MIGNRVTVEYILSEFDAREVYWIALEMALQELPKEKRIEIREFVRKELAERRTERRNGRDS